MKDNKFVLKSNYKLSGDQGQAVEMLSSGIMAGYKAQTLLGVTGSGKTFTMANIIEKVNRPTLVLAHNKTLAAQLCSEFKEFFPDNAVEFFVSYYDYYQPEAYLPGKDVYIEKDASINSEIDKLRHSATSALFERRDVIVVSSVSCIYTLGNPEEYKRLTVSAAPGLQVSRDSFIASLVRIQYERNDLSLERNKFRVRGDTVEILASNNDKTAIRVEFFGDEIDCVSEVDLVTGEVLHRISRAVIYPATHYVTSIEKRQHAIDEILSEMNERVAFYKAQNKFIEAQRIEERTRYDMEMLAEVGYCSGVENYSRVLDGREPGSTPHTLLDYFPKDYIMFIDESHVTIPQVRGMSGGDRARKKNLVDYGFRLPSAMDNRPLNFTEFEQHLNQVIYVSATPQEYEKNKSVQIVEQLIRPTGLLDPEVEVRPVAGQIDDLISEINIRTQKNERVLVTTLTKKMAEDLTEYLGNFGIKCRYMHFSIETIERMELLRDLRLGVFDVLIGINLLREGLDLPEVSLVAILDADKEGFLRSETSLIQTIGRAARNASGKVIMYADSVTGSMEAAITETNRRRQKQKEYNDEHGITPHTVIKEVRDIIDLSVKDKDGSKADKTKKMSKAQTDRIVAELTQQMNAAAASLNFELAAALRDKILHLKKVKDSPKRK
ncbi:MAG: excinuclease ABC subunit B [Clostridiales bacterium]|nr:MAG: excinuclease ABC subunit B [Clostridiales bacterium]